MYFRGVKELFSLIDLITLESDRNKLMIADSSK